MKVIIAALALVACLGVAAPLAAQSPAVTTQPLRVRPFFLLAEQRFTAADTFNAVFGKTVHPFVGGGAQLLLAKGLYADVTISRFSRSGDRAFLLGDESFSLGIPLKATITPVEVTGGYRFAATWSERLVPYAGAGWGSYQYHETADFAQAGDDVDRRSSGYLVVGGAEVRLTRWVSASADVQFTHVGGILGDAGISQQAGDTDLGGVAARFRVVIGR